MNNKSIYTIKEEFLSYLRGAGKALATIRNFERSLKYFYDFLKTQELSLISEINPDIIMRYQDYVYENLDHSQSTLKFYINDIRRFFDHLKRMGAVYDNPIRDIQIKQKKIENIEVITRYYSLEEIVRRYRHFLKTKKISFSFFDTERVHINTFIVFLEKQGFSSIYKVTSSIIEIYMQYLNSPGYFDDGGYLNQFCQIEKLRSLRRFYKWLIKEKMIRDDPTAYLEIGKHERWLKAQKRPKKANKDQSKTQIQTFVDKFLEYKNSLGLSPKTIIRFSYCLNVFLRFLKQRNIETIEAVGKQDILCYLNYLSNTHINPFGNRLAQATKSTLMNTVKQFFCFLYRFEYVSKDPTQTIDSLKSDSGIPRTLMTQREIDTILDLPDLSSPKGMRDKAILETLYSTGMRASELCHLKEEDIDFSQGFVRINFPKGGRPQQRIIPIGRIALQYVNLYLNQARDYFLNGNPDILFLSKSGKQLMADDLRGIVRGYAFKAGLRKNITTHSFRVTCATEMLKNKADIRYVQQQLGHKKITSTQIYTRLAPVDLKSVHQKTHPRENKIMQNEPKDAFLACGFEHKTDT